MRVKLQFEFFWDNFDPDNWALLNILSRHFEIEVVEQNGDIVIYTLYGQPNILWKIIRKALPFSQRYKGFPRPRIEKGQAGVFYSGESTSVNMSSFSDFSVTSSLDQHNKHLRLPLYALLFLADRAKYSELLDQPSRTRAFAFPRNRFCNFLYSHDRPERSEFFDKLVKYKPVDSPGISKNNMARPANLTARDGQWWESKSEFLRDYKFTIAFENESCPGYVTEKIFDPLFAGSVPIYWGNEHISQEFNPKAFINCHDFDSFDQLIERVKEVDRDDFLYRDMQSQPVFTRENIYLNEERIVKFFTSILEQMH